MPYLENGDMVEVLTAFNGGVVVQRMFEENDEDVGLCSSDPFIVNRVFNEPPVAKWDEKLTKANDRLLAIQNERQAIEESVKSAKETLQRTKREIDEYRKMSAEDAVLKRIYECLNGKVTHVVFVSSYEPKFLSMEQALSVRWSGELRYLSLSGYAKADSPNQKLGWRLARENYRRDYEDEVIPCLSLEEAREAVRPLVLKHLRESMRSSDALRRAIENANANGIAVDQKYVDALAAMDQAAIDEKRKRLADEMAKLESESA